MSGGANQKAASEPAVELRELGIRFGDFQALEGVSFRLPAGAFMAILGPNGAGKSTLLKTLLGLHEATTGWARIHGRSPREAPPSWVGYVPQIKTLERSFPAAAVELVLTGLLGRWPWRVSAEERALALDAMERTSTAHLARRPIGHLSGGELQRVYLARGLVRRPRIMLLDEPASGMDALGEADMYDRLEDYQCETNATVLMITHDWQVARHHADYVFVMDRRPVSFGPPEEALTEAHLREAFGHTRHTHPPRKLSHRAPDTPGELPRRVRREGGASERNPAIENRPDGGADHD